MTGSVEYEHEHEHEYEYEYDYDYEQEYEFQEPQRLAREMRFWPCSTYV